MSLHNYTANNIHGQTVNLLDYKNYVVLVVNTASHSEISSQLNDLEKLYQKYKDKNFIILAFPCNDFNQGEPNTNYEILKRYTEDFSVTFPIMEKCQIVRNEIPLYEWIKFESSDAHYTVTENFVKLLFDKNGNYVRKFNHYESPSDCQSYIETLL